MVFRELEAALGVSETTSQAFCQEILTMDEHASGRSISCFVPKYKSPREDRSWVWQITFTPLATDEMRVKWAVLIRSLKDNDSFYLETRRAGQPGLERDLWDDLSGFPQRG